MARTWLLGSLAAVLLLGAPQAAFGAVRCVPVSGPGCDASYGSINSAVGAAASNDTIRIAAGTYAESVTTSKLLNFVGAGAGTLDSDAGATVVKPASGGAFTLSGGGSLRSLKAVGASGSSGSTGIYLQPSTNGSYDYAVQDVVGIGGNGTDVSLGFPGNGIVATSTDASKVVHVTMTGGAFRAGGSLTYGGGSAVGMSGPALTAGLVGTTMRGTADGRGTCLMVSSSPGVSVGGAACQAPQTALIFDSVVDVRRSRFEAVPGAAYGFVVEDGSATTATVVNIFDSLITTAPTATVNAHALDLYTFSGGNPATLNVVGSTIVARGTDPQYGVFAKALSGPAQGTINLRNTIVDFEGTPESDEAAVAADNATVTAANSSFDTRRQLNAGTVTAPGSGANLTGDPLFTSFAAGDYTLLPTSPLIDRGDPAVVTAGELDLAGNPRAQGAPDIGAFEYQPPAKPATPPPAENAAPALAAVSMTNRVFAPVEAKASAARARRARVKRGTTFRYKLSEPATVTIGIQRKVSGRRVHGHCAKATRRNRRHRRCTRWVTVGTLHAAKQAGQQSTPFTGRFRRKALTPGHYRARIRARDTQGARSRERRLSFKIVRAR
jgi:hypothetical protein